MQYECEPHNLSHALRTLASLSPILKSVPTDELVNAFKNDWGIGPYSFSDVEIYEWIQSREMFYLSQSLEMLVKMDELDYTINEDGEFLFKLKDGGE